MITVIRTANIHQGIASQDAFEWGVQVANYLNDKWGTKIQVQRTIGGNLNQVHWLASYDSLAHLEELAQKFEADPDYIAMVTDARSRSLLSTAGLIDTIYQSVP